LLRADGVLALRGTFREPGLFGGDLFTVGGSTLYREGVAVGSSIFGSDLIRWAGTDVVAGRVWSACDRCDQTVPHNILRFEWTGLLVCNFCIDPRPPELDAPNVGPEGMPIDNPRPAIEQSGPNATNPNDL